MSEKVFMTVEEVAEVFGVEPMTVRGWLRGGVLRGVRVGRRWFVLEEDILRIINKARGKKEERDGMERAV